MARGPFRGVPASGAPSGVGLLLAGAGPGFDGSGGEVDAADAVVADVADEQPALRVEGDAVGLAELRGGGGSAIAAEAGRRRCRRRWR